MPSTKGELLIEQGIPGAMIGVGGILLAFPLDSPFSAIPALFATLLGAGMFALVRKDECEYAKIDMKIADRNQQRS